jgi:spore coat protein H
MVTLLLAVACAPDPYLPWVPPDVATDPEDPPVATPTLVINEVMTDNESTLQLDDLTFPDWIELYNASPDPVELGDVELWDPSDNPWTGPGDITLQPGESYVVYADGEPGPAHADFALSSDGDELALTVGGKVVDRFRTGWLPNDIAWARYPDGGTWDFSAIATPGYANGRRGIESRDPRDGVFQFQRVLEVHMEIDESQLVALDGGGGWWGSRQQVPAYISIDGVVFPEVGVKLKGSGSFQPLSGKAAFKIDLDDFQDTRQFRGLDHLTFNNLVHDASGVHEVMTYESYRAAGIAAPRVGYAHITLNGTDYGLYANVETYDNNFIRAWWGDDAQGELFEGMGDFGNGQEDQFHYEWGPTEDPDLEPLRRVSAAIDAPRNDPARMDKLAHAIDLDEFTDYMALEALVMDWDGYEAPNNYRLYYDPISDRVSWMPTGMDWTWDFYFAQDPWYGNGAVYKFCLNDRRCERRVTQSLVDMAVNVQDLDLTTRFDDIIDWLGDDLLADPRTPHTRQEMLDQRVNTRENITKWPKRVRKLAQDELDADPQ